MTLINDIIKRLKKRLKGAALVFFICAQSFSVSAQTHYFDADAPGHGVSVTQDGGQGSLVSI